MNALLADLLVIVHFSVVVFMVLGLVLILAGGARRWAWVRNPWFRIAHLGIMGYIALNALRGQLCFLTLWEHDLRREAGQQVASDMSFIGRLFRDLLYVDMAQEELDKFYLAFGALVVVSVIAVRPRKPRWRGSKPKTRAPRPM